MVYREELETIINWNPVEDMAIVYTRDRTVIHKLDKLCEKYPDQYRFTKGTKTEKYYKVDKNFIKFIWPTKVDEERRNKARALMKEINEKRWDNKNTK